MMAIFTKYLGPTNTRGSKVKAWADWAEHKKQVTLHWDDGLSSHDNHAAAAKALAAKLNWFGRWYQGATEVGYVFVRVDAVSDSFKVKASDDV